MNSDLAIQSSIIKKNLKTIQPIATENLTQQDIDEVAELLYANNAVLISHYYTSSALQELTEKTGGKVADSLVMTQFGNSHKAETLIVSGVRFMGETAKIFNPHKNVLVPDLQATCSLDVLCPEDEFAKFIQANPDREVVVYINTSAKVKALADWVVTSSMAVDLIEHLVSQDKKILWAPDKHLGSYLQKTTGADMILWDGACVVHEEFKYKGLMDLKGLHPKAAILAHPEAPLDILAISDVIGSTSKLITAASELPNEELIVATDQGIFYKMQQLVPNKRLFIAPTAGSGATCKSCAHCPWMALNSVAKIKQLLTQQDARNNCTITLDEELMLAAKKPLLKMLDFVEQL